MIGIEPLLASGSESLLELQECDPISLGDETVDDDVGNVALPA